MKAKVSTETYDDETSCQKTPFSSEEVEHEVKVATDPLTKLFKHLGELMTSLKQMKLQTKQNKTNEEANGSKVRI